MGSREFEGFGAFQGNSLASKSDFELSCLKEQAWHVHNFDLWLKIDEIQSSQYRSQLQPTSEKE